MKELITNEKTTWLDHTILITCLLIAITGIILLYKLNNTDFIFMLSSLPIGTLWLAVRQMCINHENK